MKARHVFLLLCSCGAPPPVSFPVVTAPPAQEPQSQPTVAQQKEETKKEETRKNFSGTIAQLRSEGAREGLQVSFDGVVVVSNAGNKKRIYVADVEGGAGIEVELCDPGCDKPCTTPQPKLGSTLKLSGRLNAYKGHLRVQQAKIEDLGMGAEVEPVIVTIDDVELGANTKAIHGSYVKLEGLFVIDDITPGEPNSETYKNLNASFPNELVSQCGENLTSDSTAACCPKCIGPRFFSIVVRHKDSGKRLALSTEHYRDLDFSIWACSARDLPLVVKVGDELDGLAGVIDYDYEQQIFKPTRKTDYVLIRN